MLASGPVGVEAGVALLQGHLWIAVRTFEVAGGLVPAAADPRLKALLATTSAHAGWHAGELRARLEVLSNVPAAAAVAPPGWEALLVEVAAADGDVEVLVGLARALLPRSVVRHRAHLARCTPVADAPVARTLRHLLADEEAAWADAEALLQASLTDAEAVRRVASHQGRLDAAAIGGGA